MWAASLALTVSFQRSLGLGWRWRIATGVTQILVYYTLPGIPPSWTGLLIFVASQAAPPVVGLLGETRRAARILTYVLWVILIIVFVLRPYRVWIRIYGWS